MYIDTRRASLHGWHAFLIYLNLLRCFSSLGIDNNLSYESLIIIIIQVIKLLLWTLKHLELILLQVNMLIRRWQLRLL